MLRSSAGASNKIARLVLIATAFLAVSCSSNILSEMSNQTSDEALLEGVKRAMADADYATAVTKCTQLSTAFQADADAVYTCASAYAGRTGMDFLDLVGDISSAVGSGGTFLTYMMGQNNGSVAQDITDLDTAITLIRTLGAASVRTTEQNALMTLISIHTLGVISNLYADTDDNGAADGGYNSCSAVSLPVAGANLALDALWEIQESGALSGSTAWSALATLVDTYCDLLPAPKQFCDDATPNAFDANDLLGARSAMSENLGDFGLGPCSSGGPACECP